MKTESENPARRRILIAILAAIAGARIVPTIVNSEAHAATLLRLAEDDPAAKALKYHIDAAEAPRTDKAGTPAEKQFCHNCSFIQADDGEWRPCQIFPSKAVNANGWCTAWSLKS